MRFINSNKEMTADILKEHKNIVQIADIFRKLHTSGVDTEVRFEVFEMVEMYENLIKSDGTLFYEDYFSIKQQVLEIKMSLDAAEHAQRVPCHNDSLVDNWVLDKNGKLYLVDWEYSGMNEPMWDLSCLSIEADYSDDHDIELLTNYYQHSPSLNEKKRFLATKLYVDLLWTLWGLTRVPFDGQFMQNYADERYLRLKNNLIRYSNML